MNTLVDFGAKVHKPKDHSHGTDNGRYWNRSEKRLWGITLLVGGAVIYSSRFTMPVCASAIARELDWSKTTSGTVLSCFFWGYSMTQIISGYQADRIGGEVIMFTAAIIWSLMTFWTPQVLYFLDFKNKPNFALIVIIIYRVIYGAVQGMHFPAMVNIMASKLHPDDKTLFTSVVFSGSSVGIIFCGILATWILHHFSWPYVFNFIGIICITWLLFFRFYVLEKSKRKSQVISLNSNITTSECSRTKLKVPWLFLLTRKEFWALIVAHFGHAHSWFIVFSWIPSFFHEKFPETPAYIYSSVPYLLSVFTSYFAGYLGEQMLKRKYSVTFVRKFIHSLSQLTVAFGLFFIAQCKTSSMAVTFLCLVVAGSSFSHASTLCNVQDILPQYAGSMFGVMNTAGAIPSFIGVYVCGYILDTTGSWQIVFNMTLFLNLVGLATFIAFGSGKKIEFRKNALNLGYGSDDESVLIS